MFVCKCELLKLWNKPKWQLSLKHIINRLVGLPLADAEGTIGINTKRYKARGGAGVFLCVCKRARVQNDSSAQLPCVWKGAGHYCSLFLFIPCSLFPQPAGVLCESVAVETGKNMAFLQNIVCLCAIVSC